jgi:hypothetical protein
LVRAILAVATIDQGLLDDAVDVCMRNKGLLAKPGRVKLREVENLPRWRI